MSLPISVRIGYLTCPVKAIPGAEAETRGISGHFDEDTGIIEVAESLSPSLMCDALLHEMLHCACLLGNAGLETEPEERVVRVLSTMLLGMMRDNPELFVHFAQTVRG